MCCENEDVPHARCIKYEWVVNEIPLLVFIALCGVCVFRKATCLVVLVGCTVTSPSRLPDKKNVSCFSVITFDLRTKFRNMTTMSCIIKRIFHL